MTALLPIHLRECYLFVNICNALCVSNLMGSLCDHLHRPLHRLGVHREGGEAVGLFQGGVQDLHGEALDDVWLMHADLPVNKIDQGKGLPIKLLDLQRSDTSQDFFLGFFGGFDRRFLIVSTALALTEELLDSSMAQSVMPGSAMKAFLWTTGFAIS